MLKKLSSYKSSEFKKNVAIIFSGSLISQVIVIAATPFLSRLYTPEQYGLYGLFLSIVTVTGSISSFRYTNAIQITPEQTDAQLLMSFCRVSIITFSTLVLLVLAASYSYFISFFKAEDLGYYIFLLSPATLLTGLTETYSVWLNRNKSFKSLSYNRILVSLTTVLVTIGWAYIVDRSFKGLLIGMIVSQSIGIIFLHLQSRQFQKSTGFFNWENIKPLLKSHKNFPIYAMPSDLINVFTNQLPVFMLNRFAGNAEVGYFNMSNRILGLPSVFISNSIGEVFRQRATEDYYTRGNCRQIFVKTFKSLFLIGLLPFTVIALTGHWIFAIALGAQWETAGEYSRVLSIMFFLRFCISPISYIYYIANKQREDLVIHMYFIISNFLIFYAGYTKGILFSLLLYSINYCLIYGFVLFRGYLFSVKKNLAVNTD